MGAKKKKGGKKKGGGDDEMDTGKLNMILEAQVMSMQQRIVLEQQQYTNSCHQQENSRIKELELDERMEDHKRCTREKIREMTMMYRTMERDLQSKIKD